MSTSEGRDGQAQVFLLLVLLFFPLYGNLNKRQKKRKAGENGHVLRNNYEACDNTHAYFCLLLQSIFSPKNGAVYVLPQCIDIFNFILLHEKFLQFDWFSAVVFQLNFKYLHV